MVTYILYHNILSPHAVFSLRDRIRTTMTGSLASSSTQSREKTLGLHLLFEWRRKRSHHSNAGMQCIYSLGDVQHTACHCCIHLPLCENVPRMWFSDIRSSSCDFTMGRQFNHGKDANIAPNS